MYKPASVGITLLVSAICGLAQPITPLQPSSVTPKLPEPVPLPVVTNQGPRSPRSPEGDKPLNPDTIKAIVIVKSEAEVRSGGLPSTNGVILHDIPFLDHPDFKQKIQTQFLGRPITENVIKDLEDAIILYCRAQGRLLVDVILLNQNIDNGVLQLWLLEGKVGKVTVNNPGRKWFSDKFVLGQVHLRPDQPLDSQQLNKDLNWLNNNPFRQVDVRFQPGEKLGLTDVQLNVDDRFPVRPYVGFENTGTRYTGPNRFVFGANWGEAFFQDGQLNYQYVTDVTFSQVQANSGSYIAPLPWQHTLILYGAYVQGTADFGGGTTSEGTSWQTSMRYSIPLPNVNKYRQEFSLGFDFKVSNNNLQSGGTTVTPGTNCNVAQFVVGYSGVLPDRYGQTSFGVELYYSPGGLTPNNSDADFNVLRPGASADYFYSRLTAQRMTRLPYNFSWIVSGWGQATTQRLLPTEQLGIGGWNTVRGYDERVLNGDDGWIVSNEIRTPPISMGNLLEIPGAHDELQFLGFWDCGADLIVNPGPSDGNTPNKVLMGIGAGVRYTMSRNLSVRFDYGFPLTNQYLNEWASRGYVGVLLSF